MKEKDPYTEKRNKLFNLFDSLLGNKRLITEIINSTNDKEKSTGFFNKLGNNFQIGANALLLGINNAGNIISIAPDKNFLKKEAKVFSEFLKNKKNTSIENETLPFFISMFRDGSVDNYLESPERIKKINDFLESTLPVLLEFVYSSIEKSTKPEAIDSLRIKLYELQKLPKPNDKNTSTEIEDITKQITKQIKNGEIIADLKSNGINLVYIQTHVLPLAITLIQNALTQPSTLINIANLALDNKLLDSKNIKPQTLNIVTELAKLLQGKIIPTLDTHKETIKFITPNILRILQKDLKETELKSDKAIESEPKISAILKSSFINDIEPEKYKELIPLAINISNIIFKDNKDIFGNIYQKYISLEQAKKKILEAENSGQDINQAKANYNLLQLNFVDIVLKIVDQELINLVAKDLVSIVEANKSDIDKIAFDILTNSSELRQDITALGLSNQTIENAVPVVSELAIEILKGKGEIFNNIKEKYQEFRNTDNPKLQNEALVAMASDAVGLLSNDDLWKVAGEKLTPVIASALKEIPAAKPLLEMISADKVSDLAIKSIPKILPVAGALLNSLKDKGNVLNEIQQNYKIFQNLTDDHTLQNKILIAMVKDVLPLLKNDKLWKVTGKLVAQIAFEVEPIKPIIEGVEPEALGELTTDLLSFVNKLANSAIKEPNIAEIVGKVREVIDAKPKEQSKKIDNLIDSLLEFKKKNPDINNIISKDLPKLIESNAEVIGKITDNLLKDTKLGKSLKLQDKGQEMLNIINKKLPELIEVASLYKEGNYKNMVPKLLNIVFDKDIFKLAVTSAVNFIKFKYNEYKTTSKIKNILKQPHSNLGDKKSDILKDIDKDLIGFGFKNLHFDNLKIDGFNFNEASLKNVTFKNSEITHTSFKNSNIINTSFENIDFKSKIDFSGSNIDAKSLKTLAPAIRKYNEQHEDKITLDKVTITGDISQISLKGISLIKADLSEAVLLGEKILDDIMNSIKVEGLEESLKTVLKEINTKKLGTEINAKLDGQKFESIVEELAKDLSGLKNVVKDSIQNYNGKYDVKEITTYISDKLANNLTKGKNNTKIIGK